MEIIDTNSFFSKEKNKILMCVIPTRNYYKLREGIKVIDKDAFISITDSYEVINQDVTINKKGEEEWIKMNSK